MRITTNMMMNRYLYNLNGNLNRLSKYVEQETTGKAINNISDDPVGVTKSLLARNRLSGTGRYQDNVKTSKDWLTEEDSSLSELNKVVQAAYEDAVGASAGTLSPDELSAMAEEVRQLRDEALSTGNATMGNSYLFAGYSTTGISGGKPPFSVDASGDIYYNGINMSNEASADDISEAADGAAKALGNATDANTTAQGASLSDREEILPAVNKVVGYAEAVSSAASKAAASAQDIAASADVQNTMMGKLLNNFSTAAGTASKAASDAANAAFSASDAMQAATDTENKAYSAWQSAIGTAGETDAHNAYTAAKSAADTATTAARTASADAVTKASGAKTAVDNINSIVSAFGAFKGAEDSAAGATTTAQAALAGNKAADAVQVFANASAVIGDSGAIAASISALQTVAGNADAGTATIADVNNAITNLKTTINTYVGGWDALNTASAKLDLENKDALSLQVGDEYDMQISEPGTELLGRGSENLYVILDGFYKALKSGKTGKELNGYIDKLSGAQNRILSLDAKVGAKVERLGTLSDRYEANVTNYTQMRSDAEDVDMAEAIMHYSSAKTVYDAALASGSQIIQTSLIDFLR